MPAAARDSPSTDKPSRLPWILGLIASAVWLAIAIWVVVRRRGDLWPIVGNLQPNAKRLELNALGDMVAGIFAPLAFLWLFIATWLQRQELGLQRQELADTRKVLDAQMEELKRSAAESVEQTRIMQATLEAARYREVYDEFDLRLYFIALKAFEQRALSIHRGGALGARRLLSLPDSFVLSRSDSSSVDILFRALYSTAESNIQETVRLGPPLSTSKEFGDTLGLLDSELMRLLNDVRLMENGLVAVRCGSLNLPTLRHLISELRTKISRGKT